MKWRKNLKHLSAVSLLLRKVNKDVYNNVGYITVNSNAHDTRDTPEKPRHFIVTRPLQLAMYCCLL